MNQIIERRDEVIANHDEYFSQLDTEEAEIIELLAEDDEHMEEVRDSAVEAAGEMREMRDELWDDFVEMLAKHAEAGWYHPPVPPPAETDDAGVLTAFSSRKWLDDFDTPENIREWEELQTGAVESFKTLVSSAPVIGFTFSFLEAVGGTDVFTGRKLTPSARAWAWLTVLSTVVGGGVASRSASNVAGNAKNLGPLLSLQRQLATLVNRQGQVVTKWLSSSNSELG